MKAIIGKYSQQDTGHENDLVAAFSSSESWPYPKGIHEDRSQEGECAVKSSHRSE